MPENLANNDIPPITGYTFSTGGVNPTTMNSDGFFPADGLPPVGYNFVNAPRHYNVHPSGVECQIIIRECKDPMIAFAMKHLWRSQWGGKPGQTTDQDLAKAIEYIELEQARRAGVPRLSEKKAQQ